jgi:hypothetical protein
MFAARAVGALSLIAVPFAGCGEELGSRAESAGTLALQDALDTPSFDADDECRGYECPPGTHCEPLPPEVRCLVAPCVHCVADAACEPYPLASFPDPDARALAEADLAAIAVLAGSTPTMSWSDARGTPLTVFGLDLPLPQCTAGSDAGAIAWAAVAEWPGLFAIDATEWAPPNALPCENVGSSSIAGERVKRDNFEMDLRRRGDGTVVIANIIANFVPPASAALAANMHACGDLEPEHAAKAALNRRYPYVLFNQCIPYGTGVYTPSEGDQVVFEPEPFWLWDSAGSSHVLLQKFHTAYLIVHPDHVTPELLDSNAACPDEVGFRITFDAATGEILSDTPGVSCVVC